MRQLADLAQGRDNNFNLIRVLAATAVLVSHAWPLSLGAGTPEPLLAATGKALGTWAVEVFFILSGFLIAASFARRPNARDFLAARALRLFPGLLVSLLVVALVMGPAVTTLTPAAYLADPGVAAFVLRNLTLVFPLYTLPGVFEANPYPSVEGSIWTLVHEVICYMGVLAAGLLGAFRTPRRLLAALVLFAALWLAYELAGRGLHPRIDALHRLSLPFATGVLAFALRDRLPLAAAGIPLLAALAFLLRGTPLAAPAATAALAYVLFWLAYVPRGWLLAYNRLGDYSYGIYIYAFPLQGLAVWLWGPMTPAANILLALPMTLACAVLSWHLVEAPALRRLRRQSAASA